MNTNDNLKSKSDYLVKELPTCAKPYFDYLRNENRSERTISQYAYDIKRFFEYVSSLEQFKNKDLNKLNIDDILDNVSKDDLLEYSNLITLCAVKDVSKTSKPQKNTVSSNYVARKTSSLQSFYKFFQEKEYIKSNPSIFMAHPKLKRKNILIMEVDEIQRILDAINDTSNMSSKQVIAHSKIIKRDKAIIMLLLGTGLRVSEMVGIDLNDIDLKEASIKVLRKGGDEGEVFISPDVENAIRDYIENERPKTSECALFISSRGTRLTDRSVEMLVKEYARKAGLNKKITPHMFRRTFGTTLYETTSDIYLTANALNHKSIDTTRKHYVRQNRELTRAAVTKLNMFKS